MPCRIAAGRQWESLWILGDQQHTSIQYGTKKPRKATRFFVKGMRESNSHQKFWRLLSYHLTNPLYTIDIFGKASGNYQMLYTIYLQNHIQSTLISLSSSFLFLSPFGYALDRLVTVSYIHYCTSTSVLSTLSSSRGLTNLTLWDISS